MIRSHKGSELKVCHRQRGLGWFFASLSAQFPPTMTLSSKGQQTRPPDKIHEAQDILFCQLDGNRAGIARDALQSFALLACPSATDGAGICRVIRASKAMERLLECDVVESKMPSMLGKVFGSATSQSTLTKLQTAVQNSLSFHEKMICVTAGKQSVWGDVSLEPIRADLSDPASSVVCFALFIRNIDEVTNEDVRREHDAEYLEDLEYDHKLQRQVVGSALLDTTIIQQVDGSFDVALRGLGLRPSVDMEMLESALQDHEPISCDIMCYKSDGTPYWRHILAAPLDGGDFLIFSVDTTRKSKFVGLYEVGMKLGSGSFGTVKTGRHSVTKCLVAIKRVEVTKQTKKAVEREIRIQQQLKSPMVVELIEVHGSKRCLYMIMELLTGGSLFDSVIGSGAVSEEKGRNLFRQCAEAVQYCHTNGIVHRDLKPENFMLDITKTKILLIDFGLSDMFVPGQKLTEICGSERFMAPEMLQHADDGSKLGYEGPPVDVWSLAVILFELVNGQIRVPKSFAGDTAGFIRGRATNHKSGFTDGLTDLICKMLNPDPSGRISTDEVFEHPWMTMDKSTFEAPDIIAVICSSDE